MQPVLYDLADQPVQTGDLLMTFLGGRPPVPVIGEIVVHDGKGYLSFLMDKEKRVYAQQEPLSRLHSAFQSTDPEGIKLYGCIVGHRGDDLALLFAAYGQFCNFPRPVWQLAEHIRQRNASTSTS